MTTTWYILPPIDRLCFKCPIPRRCNESDPRCLRRQALATGNVSRRKPTLREVQVLDYLQKHPDKQHRIKDIALAIGAPYPSVKHVLGTLQDKNQATTTGQRKTRRWTANPTPETTAEFDANTGTNATS